MQIIFQFIGIQIILTMEVSGSIYFRLYYRINIIESKLTIHFHIHIIGTDAAALSAADIVNMPPEALIQRTVSIKSRQISHQSSAVSVRTIFKHIIETIMELNGISYLGHSRSYNSSLTQTHPVIQTAFDYISFCCYF